MAANMREATCAAPLTSKVPTEVGLLLLSLFCGSHGLRQLDDNSVACKLSTDFLQVALIVKTCYQQAFYKLFQQVVTSLQMTLQQA